MKRSEQFPEIREIADAICNYTVTPEQKKELEQLLSGNFEAQRFYYDYVSIHMQLETHAEDNMEFIYRRMTEEFVLRQKDRDHKISASKNLPLETMFENDSSQYADQPSHMGMTAVFNKVKLGKKQRNSVIGILCLLVVVLTWLLLNKSSEPFRAKILQGHLSIVAHGNIDGGTLSVGEYLVEQNAIIVLPSGDSLQLDAHSVVKLFNPHEIKLTRGVLKLNAISQQNIMVHMPSFSVNSNGSDLAIDLTQQKARMTTGEGTLLLPSRWRPKHFWPFENQSDRVIDLASNAFGIPAKGTTRTKGLVGQGAYYFNNHSTDRIDLGSGGGTVSASGTFSVSDGVTIEALIRPEYSGDLDDIDQIFSKDTGDEKLRMVLGFQHNSSKQHLLPDIDVNESLEFGLYILGQGYNRLKLPLDGVDGRPTLAQLKDGNMHHVVVTYSVNTGLKAIYIDGQMLAYYQYPPGSKMLTGGPGSATIGNTEGEKRWKIKSFSGVIDEVAFYDFALPYYMVQQHWQYAQRGKNYFGFPPNSESLPHQLILSLPVNTTFELDHLTGLPQKLIVP